MCKKAYANSLIYCALNLHDLGVSSGWIKGANRLNGQLGSFARRAKKIQDGVLNCKYECGSTGYSTMAFFGRCGIGDDEKMVQVSSKIVNISRCQTRCQFLQPRQVCMHACMYKTTER